MNTTLFEAKQKEEKLIKLRRVLHTVPEIGDALPQTKNIVCEYLDGIGVPYRCLSGCDGIIAEIKGGGEGKTIAFRADMDGLHINENTGLAFSSRIPGQMHGCGHDAHTAMLLIATELLWERRGFLNGSVRLLFQTGEETGSGAKHMIAEDALDGVDAICAIHVGNLAGDHLSSGDFAILPGFVSAGKIKFTITVKGKGTHSAFPEKGIDPIIIAAKILLGFKEITEKELPAGTAAVLSVGSVHAGEDHNTIPETAVLKGSVRAQDPLVREFIARRVREISESAAEEAGASCIVDAKKGSESVRNDEELAELAADAVESVFGADAVLRTLPRPLMASDDFANYAQKIPGVYFMLHTNNKEKGITEANHNPRFDLDEDVLCRGTAAYVAIAERLLS